MDSNDLLNAFGKQLKETLSAKGYTSLNSNNQIPNNGIGNAISNKCNTGQGTIHSGYVSTTYYNPIEEENKKLKKQLDYLTKFLIMKGIIQEEELDEFLDAMKVAEKLIDDTIQEYLPPLPPSNPGWITTTGGTTPGQPVTWSSGGTTNNKQT